MQQQKCDNAGNVVKKTRRNKEEVEKEPKNSLIKGERCKNKNLNEKADEMEKCEDAVSIITAYEEIIKTKKKHFMHCL